MRISQKLNTMEFFYLIPAITSQRFKFKIRLRVHDITETRAILFALGFHRVKVKGKLALPSEAPVTVIAPHSSFLDILLLSEYGKAPSGISGSNV